MSTIFNDFMYILKHTSAVNYVDWFRGRESVEGCLGCPNQHTISNQMVSFEDQLNAGKCHKNPFYAHLLPHLANCMDIELWFSRRCMRFIKMPMNSSNIIVKTITNMDIYGLYSVMGANKIFLQSKFCMEEMNMYEMWKQYVNSESDEVRMSV